MSTSYKNTLASAKRLEANSQRTYGQVYARKINALISHRLYFLVPSEERRSINSALEEIITKIERFKPPQSPPSSFDSERATKARLEAGFNYGKQLAAHLQISAAAVCRYESGQLPQNPKGKSVTKYLLWLKEKGYDPYNLK